MFSQTSGYVMQALAYIVSQDTDRLILSREIAEQTGVPTHYLSKVLRTLTFQGILSSVRGTGGGFKLACDPKKVTVREVISMVEDLGRFGWCVLERKPCDERDHCVLHFKLGKITREYEAFLDHTTLADLKSDRLRLARPAPE